MRAAPHLPPTSSLAPPPISEATAGRTAGLGGVRLGNWTPYVLPWLIHLVLFPCTTLFRSHRHLNPDKPYARTFSLGLEAAPSSNCVLLCLDACITI